MARRPLELLLVLAVVAALAWWVRNTSPLAHPYAPTSSGDTRWFSLDPDGLYHTRRVARALDEGLSIAERDPYLNFPEGAAIPWPPYYDLVLAVALGPFAPDDPDDPGARRAYLERAVATAPLVFGVATACAAALCGWILAGTLAALVAGSYCALTRGAVNYTVLGNGDHTAWVSFLTALLFLLLTHVLARGVLARPRRSLLFGAACGVLAGLMLGAWVASLIPILLVQLALGWLVVRRAREPLPGLAIFGLALHLAALAVLLPAVLTSPWREQFPWMVVNLSWFHAAELALGALVFAPLAVLGNGALATGTREAARYPWLVALALALGGLALFLAGVGPAAGIREGFDWVSRRDSFMDVVQESEPLYGPRAEPGALFFALGYGAPLAVLAWIAIVMRAVRRHELALVPWAIALPVMALQALQQRRFSEALALPLAVALGLGAAWLAARFAQSARSPLRAWFATALAFGLVLLAQGRTLAARARSGDPARNWAVGTRDDYFLGERRLVEWLRERARPPHDASVLAHWDKGHVIEWAGDHPTVATNFGSYVGEDSYRDPPRFFMSEDPAEAEAVLERHRSRWVLVTAALPSNLSTLIRASDPARGDLYLQQRAGGRATTERWLSTVGAMLLADGAPRNARFEPIGNSLGFLRLVHVSPFRDTRMPDPLSGAAPPCGTIWERVAGARVEARGASGEVLEVSLEVAFPGRDANLRFRARSTAGPDGTARVRVPYATDAPNGEGRAVGPAHWRMGARTGEIQVSESAVLAGESLHIE